MRMRVDDIKKIAVLGAGAMGHGIAMVALLAGYNVVLRDINQEFVDKGVKAIRDDFEKFYVAKGELTEEELDKIMNEQLTTAVDMKDAASDIDFAIEAVPEIMKIKKEVFADLDKYAPKHAILASNTSNMSITEIAKATKREEKVVGTHFFNPPTIMRLVEVIKGEKTIEETMQVAVDLMKIFGKIPVRVEKDSPGFIANRVIASTIALLGAILDQKVAMPEEIDAMMKKFGQPMGPYELLDYVGLDVVYDGGIYFSKILYPDYAPAKAFETLVKDGHLGMKTGKGVYDWSRGRPKIDLSKSTDKLDPIDLMSVEINEGIKLVEEGVCTPKDVDIAMKYGYSRAKGPFEMAEDIPHDLLKDRLEKLAHKFNKKIFEPTETIKDGRLGELLKKAGYDEYAV
jgi:enoyl-CoA hydratase/3-hydroxyacyl-CoA dehydrogenase